jgi:geranylgeranyl diphosphate synthase type II
MKQVPVADPRAFVAFSNEWLPAVERALRACIPVGSTRPSSLHKAMRHSLLAGGKRLRPLLVLAAAKSCGANPASAMPAACAVELIHTYSLVHDDLPCMDNDDLRRGRPTCHKVFGEAIALLAGDALLTAAFEILATQKPTPRYSTAAFVAELANAAGSRNLIAGQVADMEAEREPVSAPVLRFIHSRKTAAMIRVCLRLGAMTANATPSRIAALDKFGLFAGLAFQIVDDILDCTQSAEVLGKSPGKDVAAGKATYPALMGLKGARAEAARLTTSAYRALDLSDKNNALLASFAAALLNRTS